MYKINFKQPIHVHFIGIGGISMSGLAEILLKEGFTVSGSDSKVSPLTEHLEAKGAQIFYGQKASNIIDGIDCVVYTAAIRRENAELMEAVAKKISNADACRTARTAHGQLQNSDRSIRNSREDHNNFYDFPHPAGRRY